MATVGYARVSSVGQTLDVQIDKLTDFGCDKIFEEKRSGTTAQRPEFKKCIDYLRDGDVLVITKLDRLARSTLHLHTTLKTLNDKKVGFKVLDQSIDTTTKEGRLTFSILACIAEFETELRKERQAEGIKKALDKGVRFGAKPKLNQKQIYQMAEDKETGLAISELQSKYNVSKASVYRLLAELRSERYQSEAKQMKIIKYYEARSKELLQPMAGGITHVAKMHVQVNVDGKNKILNYGFETGGTSKEDAEMTAVEDFLEWVEKSDFTLKRDL